MDPIKNIRYVVMSTMNRLELTDMRPYERLKVIAVEYYQENMRGLGGAPMVEVMYCKLNGNRQIAMPADYVSHLIIAALVNGRYVTLGLDERIPLLANLSPCNDTFEHIITTAPSDAFLQSGAQFVPHYHNGLYIESMFSIGGGFSFAYYRPDYARRIIQFDRDLPNNMTLAIEYLSTGKNVTAQTLMPPEWVPAMREHLQEIYWQRKDANLSTKHMFEREKYEVMARLATGKSPDEIIEALYQRSGFKLG